MTVAAHPSDLTGGISDDQRKVGNVLGDHRPCSDKCITPDRVPQTIVALAPIVHPRFR